MFCAKSIWMILLFSVAFILHSVSCEAQHEGIGGIAFGTSVISEANFQKDGKEFDGEAERFSANLEVSLSPFNMAYEYNAYTWSRVKGLPFGNKKNAPWENLHLIQAGVDHSGMLDDQNWGYFLGGGVSLAFEKEISGSYGGMGYAGLVYALPDSHFFVRVGAGAAFHEVESSVMPMGGISWGAIGENQFAISIGIPETQISYCPTPNTSISLGLSMDNGVYRLADDSTVRKEGYFEAENYAGTLSFTFKPIKSCEITMGGMYYFERTYTIYDKDGKNGKECDLDESNGGFMSIDVTF